MSPEKQRIAIATACGHSFEWQEDTGSLWVVAPDGHILDVRFPNRRSREETLSDSGQSLPDYLNDLNAMHEAEKVLKGMRLMFKYHLALAALPQFQGNNHLDTFHASAPQRAEAFLKTLGLWTED